MHYKADIYAKQPENAKRLWAAKPPLAGESCASWVQRLCGDHHYSFPLLGRILGFFPSRGDWDRYLDDAVWLRLMELGDFSEPTPTFEQTLLLGNLSRVKDPGDILRIVDGFPAYRWCPFCLAHDEIPYLRWYWRLNHVQECWVHQAYLSERCIVCDRVLYLHRARLTGRCAVSLSECADCGMSLSVPERQQVHYDRELQQRLMSLFAPWGLSYAAPDFDESIILAAKYRYIVKGGRIPLPTRSESRFKYLNQLRKKSKSWVLDASSFEQGKLTSASAVIRIPWNLRLSPKRRLAVAEALWAIRRELRANQTQKDSAS